MDQAAWSIHRPPRGLSDASSAQLIQQSDVTNEGSSETASRQNRADSNGFGESVSGGHC